MSSVHIELAGVWHSVERSLVMKGIAGGDIAPDTQLWDGRLMRSARAFASRRPPKARRRASAGAGGKIATRLVP